MNLCWFLVGLPGSDAHPWIGPDNGLPQCPPGTRKYLLVPSFLVLLGVRVETKIYFFTKIIFAFSRKLLGKVYENEEMYKF